MAENSQRPLIMVILPERCFCLFLSVLLFIGLSGANAAISFVNGDYFATDASLRTITQYNPSGTVTGSLALSSSLGDGIHGIAFGADQLLYATLERGISGFAVVALNASGSVQQTYTGSVYVAGNLSYGKIAMDSQYLYVTGQNSLTRFRLGDPTSGTAIYTNNQVFDVKPLPNGNLFVASAYTIEEITPNGNVVRTISLNFNGNSFGDIRGIEYNTATNSLFVTALGYSGFQFQLMHVNATTGALEKNTTFVYGDDIALTNSGALLVGSRTQNPGLFDTNLVQIGALGGTPRMFVTQYQVPEPAALLCLFIGSAATLILRRRCRGSV